MTAAIAERVTVAVTQEHIDLGERGICNTCAVALAILGALPGAVRVKVRYAEIVQPDVTALVTFTSGAFRQYRLPAEMGPFVLRFDDGQVVSPVTFEMAEI